MRSPLLLAGIAAILFLGAALVGPYFIDWNGYRPTIEAQVETLTGRKAVLRGQVSLRLLPFPSLSLSDLALSNPQGATEDWFLTVTRIDARLALAPLLSGEARVESIDVIEPVVNGEVLADGSTTWRLGGALFSGLIDPDQVSFERAAIHNGTMRFRDGRNNLAFEMTTLDAEISASSLAGTIAGEGEGEIGGQRRHFTLSLGAIRETGGRRLSVRAGQFNFEGELGGGEAPLSGRLTLAAGPDGAEGENAAMPEGAANGNLVSAEVRASLERIAFEKFVLKPSTSADGAPSAGTVSGDVAISLTPVPVLDAALRAERLALEDLIAQTAPAGEPQAAEPGGQAGARALLRAFDRMAGAVSTGEIRLDGRDVTWGGVALKQAGATIAIAGGKVRFSRTRAIPADGGAATLTGTYRPGRGEGEWPSFNGRVTADGIDAALVAGLPGLDRPARAALAGDLSDKRISLSGQVVSAGSAIALRKLRASIGGGRLTGNVHYQSGGAPVLTLALVAEDMAVAAPDMDEGALTGRAPLDGLGPLRVKGAFEGRNITVGARLFSRLDVAGSVSAGQMEIISARLDRDGAELTLKAQAVSAPSGLAGAFTGSLKGPGEAIAAMLAGGGQDEDGGKDQDGAKGEDGGLDARARRFGDVSAGFTGRLDARGNDQHIAVDMTGWAGSSSLAGNIDFTGNPARPREAGVAVTIDLANDNGGVLATQIGLAPDGEDGAPRPGGDRGRLRLALNGVAASGFSLSSTMEFYGALLNFTGKAGLSDTLALDGEATLSSVRPDSFYEVLGVSFENAGPIRLASKITLKDNQASFTGLRGTLGGSEIDLNGELAFSGATPRLAVTGKVGDLPGPFALDMALALLLENDAAGGLVHMLAERRLDLDIELAAGRMALGETADAEAVSLKFIRSGVVFNLENFAARFADGELSLTARGEEDGEGIAFETRFALDHARLSDIASGQDGQKLFAGRLGLSGAFTAHGRSRAGLLAGITGMGQVRLEEAALGAVAPHEWARALVAAKSVSDLEALAKDPARKGRMAIADTASPLTLSNGLLTIADMKITGAGLHGTAKTLYDLANGQLDSEWRLKLDSLDGAPGLSLVHTGPLAAITRKVDMRDLVDFLKVRSIRKRIDKLEDPPTGSLGPAPGSQQPMPEAQLPAPAARQ